MTLSTRTIWAAARAIIVLLLASSSLGLPLSAQEWGKYGFTITRLDRRFHPDGYSGAVNNAGQVAGYVSTPVRTSRYTLGIGPEEFESFAGFTYSSAQGINGSGQLAGYGGHAGVSGLQAFRYSDAEGVRELGTLGGSSSLGFAINSSGQVAGHSTTLEGLTHAFRYSDDAGIQDLGTLGGQTSEAYGINAAGQVTGWATTPEGVGHVFRYSDGTGMEDLGAVGRGIAINGAGQVAGNMQGPDGRTQAFRYTDALGMESLDVRYAVATGIDMTGRVSLFAVVGSYAGAALWEGTELFFLDEIIGGGWRFDDYIRGISEDGRQIVTSGYYSGSDASDSYVGYVLLSANPGPVDAEVAPEPATLLLLGSGLVFLVLRFRRRAMSAIAGPTSRVP